ncbi:MAG: Gfo/Idh/MocA family oxidoreductase, partial [Lentisphaeria bacterium]|nr:Gfo/Idh/MocA family oxidoreductase [Lentisphaeria bacterium]
MMIRLGVIGLGLRVGHFIRETMNAVDPDFRVVGVVDPGEKASREKMRECDQDAVFYNSIDEMVRNAKPDALLVGTRCNLHTPIAVEIEKYHLPVFLEKPVAITMDQALLLENTYRNSTTPVLVSFPLRMTPLHRRAVEMIRNGAVGDVLHITGLNYVPYGTVYYQYGYRDFDITGGLFLQKATHDFDYIMDLAGSPITAIQANWVRGRVFGGDKSADLTCANCPEAERCQESPQNRKRNDSGG